MASLWRHPKSNFHTACFTDATGRRCKRTTGIEVVPKKAGQTPAGNRKLAQTIADEYEAISRGNRSVQKVRSILLDLQSRISGQQVAAMSASKAVTEWLARREAETSDATIKAYTNATKHLLEYLGPRANLDLSLVTRQDMFDFRAARLKSVAAPTVNNSIKIIRMFFTAAKGEGWCSENPAAGVEDVKPTAEESEAKEERRPFTVGEVTHLLTLATPEWHSLVMCGLYTLQRLGDLCRLPWKGKDNWSGVFFDAGVVRLVASKTGKKMMIPMADPLRAMLVKRRAEFPDALFVHPVMAKLIVGSTGPVSKQFGNLLTLAGLRVEKEKLEGNRRNSYDLSFHCLRHAGISMMKAAGIPASVVMELAGHSTVQMSNHYTHTAESALLEAVNSLPSLGAATPPPAPAQP